MPCTRTARIVVLLFAAAFVAACRADAPRSAADGSLRCASNSQVEVYRNGQWQFLENCNTGGGEVCISGRCTVPGEPCVPASTTCSADAAGVRTCRADGGGYTTLPCPTGQRCEVRGGAAQCTAGGCTPGTLFCSGDGAQVLFCDQNARPQLQTVCTGGATCTAAGGTAACAGGDGDPVEADTADPDEADAADAEPERPSCTAQSGCGPDAYCQIDAGATAGYCRGFCGDPGDEPCPAGFECDRLNTQECKKIVGACTRTRDCQSGEYCSKTPGQDVGRCRCLCTRPGCNCTQEGTRCVNDETNEKYGQCVAIQGDCTYCVNDFDCGSQGYCEKWAGQVSGCCRTKCRSKADCPGDLICQADGRCGASQGCQDNCGGSCPQGNICDRTFCQCVLNCPACPVGQVCDANSAPNCVPGECTNPPVCGFGLRQCCSGFRCSAVVYGVVGFCI